MRKSDVEGSNRAKLVSLVSLQEIPLGPLMITMGFCPTCRRLMAWDNAAGKLVCKNDDCGVQKKARNCSEGNDKTADKRSEVNTLELPIDDFLDDVLQNYQKNIVVKNRRFKISKRPLYTIENVNFYNKESGLYLLTNRWNLPNEKYVDVRGDILTGLEKYDKSVLTFFLAETPHDMYNWQRFSKYG